MEQFSKDYFFKILGDSIRDKSVSDNKKGVFILHKLVESKSFGALKCFKFNLFYLEKNVVTTLVESWEFKGKVTEASYEEDIKPIKTKLLNCVYTFLSSDKYKSLV